MFVYTGCCFYIATKTVDQINFRSCVPVLTFAYLFLPHLCLVHHHPPGPSFSQLHEKFEQLKRMHQEEKRKVDEKRRDLDEEMNAFNRKKAAAETLSCSQPLKKDKDKKK